MLFHVKHVHTEVTCPYDKPEVVSETFARVLPSFEEAGARVVGAFTDPSAHAMYLIVDAADWDQLRAGLHPIVTIGTAEISPVTEFGGLVAERAKK